MSEGFLITNLKLPKWNRLRCSRLILNLLACASFFNLCLSPFYSFFRFLGCFLEGKVEGIFAVVHPPIFGNPSTPRVQYFTETPMWLHRTRRAYNSFLVTAILPMTQTTSFVISYPLAEHSAHCSTFYWTQSLSSSKRWLHP